MKATRVNIRIKEDLHLFYKEISEHRGVSISAMMNIALTQYRDWEGHLNSVIDDRARSMNTVKESNESNARRGAQRTTRSNKGRVNIEDK